MRRLPPNKVLTLCVAGVLLAGCNAAQPAFNPSAHLATRPFGSNGYDVLHRFQRGAGGAGPVSSPIEANGALYGTTSGGGAYGDGTVFVISAGNYHVIHAFKGATDGSDPQAGLALMGGQLYGTTNAGGGGNCPNGCGTLFSLSPSGSGFKTLHTFTGDTDGGYPNSALLAMNGTLYGTTTGYGNTSCNCGTVFSMTGSGTVTTLHSFHGGSDGAGPQGITELNGVLYGTTEHGGRHDYGTVFSVMPSGSEHVIYRFKGGRDGKNPLAAPTALEGELYGTTSSGGERCLPGCGTAFVVTTAGSERTIFGFSSGDGAVPAAALTVLKGVLYGTTATGGNSRCSGCGVIFSLTTSGQEVVLRSFLGGRTDGAHPKASLTDWKGSLFGTTFAGGGSGEGKGTVFRIKP